MVLARRGVDASRIAHILLAEQAFRITALFCQFCSRDRLRVLLRFGEVDRDIDIAVGTRYAPADQFVEVIGCLLRALRIEFFKLLYHLSRARHQAVHQFRIEQIAVNDAVVFEKTALSCIIKQFI